MIAAFAALLLQASVDDLAWMSGRWEVRHEGRWTEEGWSPPRAGTMFGYSRSGEGDAAGEWEYLRIEAGGDGVPVFWGAPGGRPAVPFRLTAVQGTSATFENPAHDYPQRIVYYRDGDALVATISAIDGSNEISWHYRRQ